MNLMRHYSLFILMSSLCSLSIAPSFAAGHCSAASGSAVIPLVELYSSEGCDSCPPADRWLSAMKQREDINVVALHVDYWDRLGWKDRFGSAAHTSRQTLLARGGPSTFVYTPEVFVAGRELRGWSGPAFDAALKVARGQAASARMQVDAQAVGNLININTKITIDQSSSSPHLIVALLEDGLSSAIGAGENRGATLHHDRVLRAWSPPQAITAPSQTITLQLPIPADANPARLSLLAWIQDDQPGRVMQSLALPLQVCF